MDAKEGRLAPSVEGVAGLIGVRSDKYYYVGKRDKDPAAVERARELGRDYVALKDAYEIVVQHRPQADGRLEMSLLPLPIGPFTEATKVVVRVDAYLDLSACANLVTIHKVMVGDSGILIPGGPDLPLNIRGR